MYKYLCARIKGHSLIFNSENFLMALECELFAFILNIVLARIFCEGDHLNWEMAIFASTPTDKRKRFFFFARKVKLTVAETSFVVAKKMSIITKVFLRFAKVLAHF